MAGTRKTSELEFLDLESVPNRLHWIVHNDPEAVEQILKKGKGLEFSNIYIPDMHRKDITKALEVFEKFRNGKLRENNVVRNFEDWRDFWESKKMKDLENAEEEKTRLKIEKAKQRAINEIRKLRPHQLSINVYQEESPSRFEEISTSSEDSEISDQPQIWCPLNVDCHDEACKLLHI